MNKKFYIGTLAIGIAASFWACGSGEIIKPNDFDGTMGFPDPEDPTMGIDVGAFKAYCPECVAAVSSSSTAPKTQKSSSSRQTLPEQDCYQYVVFCRTGHCILVVSVRSGFPLFFV